VVRLKERIEALQRLAESAARAVGVLVDGDVDALADPERRRVAPRLGERLPHDRHLLGELFRRGRPRTEEAVAMSGGAPQRIGMAGAEPYRGMRFLEWLGLHACVLQLPQSSAQREELSPSCSVGTRLGCASRVLNAARCWNRRTNTVSASPRTQRRTRPAFAIRTRRPAVFRLAQ